jgi:hypothetical protein
LAIGRFLGGEWQTFSIDELPPQHHLRFTPGDTIQDGVVDVVDLNNVRNNFGSVGDPVLGDTAPLDGIVGVSDLNAVRSFYGTNDGSQIVPEPAPPFPALIGHCAAAFGARRRN